MAAVIPLYRAYVGARAARYEAQRSPSSQWKREQAIVSKLLQTCNGPVLDIPVGTGRFAPECQRLGRSLLGMDVSEDMMCQARAKGIECRYGDARQIELPDCSVSTVVCLRLLNWFEEHEAAQALKEFQRVATTDVIFNLSIRHRRHRLLRGLRSVAYPVKAQHNIYRVTL